MKERPILFKGEMVRAILDDKKTQTRRLNGLEEINKNPDMWRFDGFDGKYAVFGSGYDFLKIKCPFGEIGDRLWVRETWGICPDYNQVRYKADRGSDDRDVYKWKPSIHMPRKFSRINLEITNRRPERLQDITEKDAQSESVEYYSDIDYTVGITYKTVFSDLWKSINGPESWDKNPWVWVIEFRRQK